MKQVLLYGANGYTGRLIARFAKDYSVQLLLAGRNEQAIATLAKEVSCNYVVLDLADKVMLMSVLGQCAAVIHAAGPFDHTAAPMIDACLQTGTHYLDLNGDRDVFEQIFGYDEVARKAGIMLLPGAGFDVVPTDCTAFFLKNKMPDATHLEIAFATPGGAISHGTAVTTIAKLGEPGAVRKDGKLIPKPVGDKAKRISFFCGKNQPSKTIFTMTIPWGDIFTAYISTGIPNITTYTGVPAFAYPLVKMQGLFNWLLRKKSVRHFLLQKVKKRPAGLDDKKREAATSLVYGCVSNATGATATSYLCGPDAYTITAHTCLIIARKILNGAFKPGYQTPASAYGQDLIMEVPGMQRM